MLGAQAPWSRQWRIDNHSDNTGTQTD